jgi:pilus assembly protein CpaF
MIELSNVTFHDDHHVQHIIEKIVAPIGRRIDESQPMVDARLPDGSRVNAIIPPLALKGPTITIRKFSRDPYGVEDLITFGTLNREMAQFLEAFVNARLNVVIYGGKGSGKTTTLNVLSSFFPEHERIITIEDAAELQLHQSHVVTLETRPPNIEGKGAITIRDLVKNSLRMRPERIIVGEVRGGEALDMLQAMNTGHDGSLTTGHANSPRDMLSRLETMVLMAGMDLPIRAIREQISSAIDVIVQQSRLRDGSRKITHITEILGMEGETIVTQDIFKFEQTGVDSNVHVLGGLKLPESGPFHGYHYRLRTDFAGKYLCQLKRRDEICHKPSSLQHHSRDSFSFTLYLWRLNHAKKVLKTK